MITREDLKPILHFEEKPESRVLTVYAHIDQGEAGNLNRGFETAINNHLRDARNNLPEDEQAAFDQAAEQVQNFLSEHDPEGKSWVFFVSPEGDWFEHKKLYVPIKTQAHWARRPYLRPLLEALDEHERFCIVLTDRGESRLFTVHLGEIVEHEQVLAEFDVKRFDASGSDYRLSQAKLERKSDEHARQHFKNVAKLADALHDRHPFDRLILAGSEDACHEVEGHLSQRMQDRVCDKLPMDMDAAPHKVLDKTAEIAERVERKHEADILEDFLVEAGKNAQAVTGLAYTIDVAAEGRIWRLLYAEDYEPDESAWNQVQPHIEKNRASFNGNLVDNPKDLVEWLVERTVDQGGTIEQLRGKPAEKLTEKAQGIGAILRY